MMFNFLPLWRVSHAWLLYFHTDAYYSMIRNNTAKSDYSNYFHQHESSNWEISQIKGGTWSATAESSIRRQGMLTLSSPFNPSRKFSTITGALFEDIYCLHEHWRVATMRYLITKFYQVWVTCQNCFVRVSSSYA